MSVGSEVNWEIDLVFKEYERIELVFDRIELVFKVFKIWTKISTHFHT